MDEFPVVIIRDDEVIEEEEFERLYSAPVGVILLLSLFYGSISILAIIGNALVMWVVFSSRQMRTVTNYYIANLALADIIIGVACIPFQFQAALLQRWNLPDFMCAFCPFMQALSVNVSVFTLTAIAVDRHRAIINPLRARATKFSTKVVILGIWCGACAFAIPCLIAFRVEMVHERIREDDVIVNVTRPFCLNKNFSDFELQGYRYALVVLQYLVPFCVISFVYIRMAVKLWGTRPPGNAQDTRDINLLRSRKKVIKMLIIVVVVFGVCWMPLQLYNILYVTIPEINEYHFISIVWFCCDWLAMSNSCYNPFIYGIYNEKFKREFNKRFAACFCKFHTTLDTQDRTMSMHTRASSLRSYANSSMRVRNNNTSAAGSLIYRNGSMKCGKSGGGSICNSNAIYNVIAYSNGTNGINDVSGGVVGGGNSVGLINGSRISLGGAGVGGNSNNTSQFVYQWRRNNFKPLHPDVIESEDDLGLMEAQSTPPLDESSGGTEGGMRRELLKYGGGGELSKGSTSSCLCDQRELVTRLDCDGKCILNELRSMPPSTLPLQLEELPQLPTLRPAEVAETSNSHLF